MRISDANRLSGKFVASAIGGVLLLAVLMFGVLPECQAREDAARAAQPAPAYSAPPTPVNTGPVCSKGCRCGNTCIDCSKTCRR